MHDETDEQREEKREKLYTVKYECNRRLFLTVAVALNFLQKDVEDFLCAFNDKRTPLK